MAETCGMNLNVNFNLIDQAGKKIDLSQVQLDPSKPAKCHLKIIRILFTPEELAVGLIEKTSSEKPLLDAERINLLKGNKIFILFRILFL